MKGVLKNHLLHFGMLGHLRVDAVLLGRGSRALATRPRSYSCPTSKTGKGFRSIYCADIDVSIGWIQAKIQLMSH